MSPSPSTILEPGLLRWAWRVVATAVLVAVAVFGLVRTRDMAPEGERCIVGSSSEQQAGVEAIRWGPLPVRTCEVDGYHHASWDEVLWWLSGVAGATAGGLSIGWWADRDRRRARRAELRVIADQVLATWRQRPDDELAALLGHPADRLAAGPGGDALHAAVRATRVGPGDGDLHLVVTVDAADGTSLGRIVVGRAEALVRLAPGSEAGAASREAP